ncbi:MAG: hypothetical protein D6796_00185 [Caldilineae bacterium]|nr:MAG: hypothetical protein D6796_00185 [Caldilineae bacterium]
MRGTEVTYHEICAENFFVGTTVFLTLALPPAWELTMGAGRPEVTASHRHDGRRWVATGDAWYVLDDPVRRWAMEVRLNARPADRPRRAIAIPDATVAGHPAQIVWKRRRRGLFQRWTVTYVTLTFHCPHTRRYLKVEFSGRPPDEAFEEVLQAARYLRCH